MNNHDSEEGDKVKNVINKYDNGEGLLLYYILIYSIFIYHNKYWL